MSDIQSLNNEHFNKAAEDYDNIPQVKEISQKVCEVIVQEFIDSTSEEHVRKATVLDFGCGTVAPKVEQVVGVDASEGMLKHLNHKLTSGEENAHIRGKIITVNHLVTHDAPLPEKETSEYLAEPNSGFDMIFSSFVMHHIEDVQGIVNTLAGKLLKKDGWLIVMDFYGNHHHHGHEHGDHHDGPHGHGLGHGEHHQHQHDQEDHPPQQGDHRHHGHGDHHQHQHDQGDHSSQQGDHKHHGHHGQDIHDHFVDKDGKPFEHVAHKGGFTPETFSEIFLKAGLVDVSAKHVFSVDREKHGKQIRSDMLVAKGRRP